MDTNILGKNWKDIEYTAEVIIPLITQDLLLN